MHKEGQQGVVGYKMSLIRIFARKASLSLGCIRVQYMPNLNAWVLPMERNAALPAPTGTGCIAMI